MVDYNEILEEPVFLVNDYLEKGQKELENVIKELKRKPKNYERNARFLKNFTNNLFIAYKNNNFNKHQEKEEHLENKKLILKQQLEEKRKELLEKMQELQQPKKLEITKEVQKDLILSKISNKVLASRKIIEGAYQLMEPFLKDTERILIKELIKEDYPEDELKKAIQDKLKDKFTEEDYEKIRYYVLRDKLGFGQVAPLFEEDIKEIVCNGINEKITITLKDKNLETNISYPSKESMNDQIMILAKKANKEVSTDHPFLDGVLPNKLQVQANLGTEYSQPRFIIHK